LRGDGTEVKKEGGAEDPRPVLWTFARVSFVGEKGGRCSREDRERGRERVSSWGLIVQR
jgi:hypothetical protein